ncbi:MAG: hypothetical protein JW722_05985 [Demequinaceae bacterium]|nr:hypothetical protein [Demequinaceae bacterium]
MKGLPKLPRPRRVKEVDTSIKGTARIDTDPIRLSRKLRKGDIAVIDAMDLDQRAAESIAAAQPAAVLNAQASISGRYPNGGPLVLARAGIALIDSMGRDVLALRDGMKVRIDGKEVFSGEEKIASGKVQDLETIAEAMESAHEGVKVQLATFTANAMDVVAQEYGLLLEGTNLPDIGVDMRGRQVVVLSAGFEHLEQIKAIRGYLRERRPIIIAVGDGADVALAHAYPPAVIVGRTEGISDEALTSGAEVVLHDPTGRDPGEARLDSLNVKHVVSHISLASEDLAILMAHAGGAHVIVTVGVQVSLHDFLEGGRSDTVGTFLSQLVAGGTLVNAKTLAQVYRHRYSPWTLVALVLSAIFVLGNAFALTPGGAAWLRSIWPTIASWFGGTS